MRRRSGFTMPEVLVAMAILAVLAALLLPAVTKVRETARVNYTKADFAKFDPVITEYRDLHRRLPPSLDVLVVDVRQNPSGIYIDAWGLPYAYIRRPDLEINLPSDPPPLSGSSPNFGMKYYTDNGKPIRHCIYQILSSGPDHVFARGGDWTPGIGEWADGQPGADDLASFNQTFLNEKRFHGN